MRVLDLFSGVGGFSLAARRVGWETVAFCEIDPFCRRVLAKHWPAVPCFEDVRELRGSDVGAVDLICGGFPCQPFSIAGAKRGEDDPRYLWPEMRRLVRECEPAWVVGENVPHLARLGLDAILADLEALGYEVAVLGLPACAVGAPQIRERLWLVAHAPRFRRGSGRTRGLAGGAEPASEHALRRRRGAGELDPWPAMPGRVGVGDGLSPWVDRVRALGNAIVPAVAERLFRWIDEAERNEG